MLVKSRNEPWRISACLVETTLPAAQRSKNSHEMYLKYQGPRKPADDAIFLTPQEAAYVLRVSYWTILKYAARKRNRPPLSRPTSVTIRFPRDALIVWYTTQGK